jgi:hypothetical protein
MASQLPIEAENVEPQLKSIIRISMVNCPSAQLCVSESALLNIASAMQNEIVPHWTRVDQPHDGH